jgi:hypothetical protein
MNLFKKSVSPEKDSLQLLAYGVNPGYSWSGKLAWEYSGID